MQDDKQNIETTKTEAGPKVIASPNGGELRGASFPGQIHEAAGGNFLTTKLDDLINWARSNSLWPLVFGTSCCAIEMMSTASAKYDFSRFGFEVTRATPRQADVIIIAGTIVKRWPPY